MTDDELTDLMRSLEEQFWQAMATQDAETAKALSDEPTVVAGASGAAVIDRATMGAMLTGATWALRSYAITDLVVHRVTDDVVVVAYRVHEELEVDGKDVAFDASDASTWVRRDGAWVCALHTESILGDAFGRDRTTP